MTTFIDTSAFLTILDADDLNNQAAKAVWAERISSGDILVTTNYVVLETTAVLHRRHGLPAVRWFVDDMLPVVHVEWVDQSMHADAMKSLLAGSRKSPSLVDCVSFEAISRLKIADVFAYDKHFEDRGFNLVGVER